MQGVHSTLAHIWANANIGGNGGGGVGTSGSGSGGAEQPFSGNVVDSLNLFGGMGFLDSKNDAWLPAPSKSSMGSVGGGGGSSLFNTCGARGENDKVRLVIFVRAIDNYSYCTSGIRARNTYVG